MAGEPEPSVTELADALLAARELEGVTTEGIHPTEGFGDRVMAAVALEPAPRLVVRPGSTVRGGRAGAFLIAVRDAWGVATTGGRPVAVRAQALAFILLVVVATGTLTSAAAIGVGGLLGPDRGSAPTFDPDSAVPTSPVGPTQATDGESPEPSETPGELQSAEPSETPEATETPSPGKTPTTGTSRPAATPRATETSEPTETAEPTDVTEPTEMPRSTETPKATGGGSGSVSSDSSGHG
jgi:hypothetical protein